MINVFLIHVSYNNDQKVLFIYVSYRRMMYILHLLSIYLPLSTYISIYSDKFNVIMEKSLKILTLLNYHNKLLYA